MNLPPWFRNALAASAAVGEREVFFVLGCQKSGTTWVQQLLDGHPHVCFRGEGHFSDVAGPILEIAVKAYNDEPKTTSRAGKPELFSIVRMFADQILAGYLAGCEDPKAIKVVGDKTPEAALAIGALNTMYPGARFVHVIRDGRDAVVSGWAHVQRLGMAERFPTLADYATYFGEHHWVPYITKARQAATALADRYLEVRYEDLHAEPIAHTRRVLEFLGVEVTPKHVSACVDSASFSRLSQGRHRGEEDRLSHFRKGIVGDWINHFDNDALNRFEAVAGDLLRELSYVDDSAPTQAVTAGQLTGLKA